MTTSGQGSKRVLIRLPNWVGDAVMAAPAVLGLAEARPDWEWILLGGTRSLPLFTGCDLPLRLLPPLPPRGHGALSFLQTVGLLHGEGLSAALVLPPSFSSALMTFAAGVPTRLGWPTDKRGWLLTDAFLRPSRLRPLREQYVELAEDLLARLSPREDAWRLSREVRRLPLRAEELAWAGTWWRTQEWLPGRTLGMAPGATYGPTKRWPHERFRDFAHRLLEDGWNVLWIGGGDEADLCRQLAETSRAGDGGAGPPGMGRSLSMAGTLTLRQSLALLSSMRAVVSNDSGALHLAQAAGCPVLGIYGSTSPVWTGPGGECQEVLSKAMPCSPCFSRTCPTQIECLGTIQAEDAHQALLRLLARTERPRRRPAVFLDRDGTVLDLVPYLSREEDTRLAPGAAEALRELRRAGYALVVITNQSAVARGLLDSAGLHRIHLRMQELLDQEDVVLDGIEACPHHPEYTGPCACRKPEPGLYLRAAHRLGLDLSRSFTIGDAESDLLAGRRAGTRTILVRSGYGQETEAALGLLAEASPDAVADDLGQAARWILSRQGERGESGS